MKRLLAVLLFAAFPAFAGVNEKMLVSTEWLEKKARERKVTVVHMGRDAAQYTAGHIPNAVLLTLDAIASDRADLPNELRNASELQKALEAAGIGDKQRIVIYGDDILLAARLFFTLDYLGHGDRASLLDGGFAKWKAEGRAIATGTPTPRKAKFTPKVQPERLVYLSQLRKLVPVDTLGLIDARPPAQYSGEQPGDGVPRGGHIPGAVNIYWQELLAEDGTLKPPAELYAIHESRKITRNEPNVTYCRSGMQASLSYFVMRYLGYDVSMYDGSFVEWSHDPATYVVP
ncbi:MAG TPA: sulfurtransferase [Thermoanaerobaculia bacterium]